MAKKISLIIPAFNEQDNVGGLYSEIKESVKSLPDEYEIIFINDGSTDGTAEAFREIASGDKSVKVISLARNYGQTPAIAAGIKHASGDLIIIMDADRQNDPRDIPNLLNKLGNDYDVVSGWRKYRKDPFFSRRLPSIIANYLISAITGVKLHDYGCTLKVYRKEFLKNFAIYGEMHRFLPAYAAWQGARVIEQPVNHRPRTTGKSKYGIMRAFNVLMDLLVIKFLLSYLTKPIYVFGAIAASSFLLGLFVNAFVIIRKLFYGGVWVSPMFFIGALLWSLSVTCILLGIVIEVLVRLYFESTGGLNVKEI